MPDLSWLLSRLGTVRSLLDVLVVTLVFYWLLWVAQGTRATQLLRGIAILLVLVYVLGTSLQLTTLNWLLSRTWPALVVGIPIIFQPELRRALEQVGHTGAWLRPHFATTAQAGPEHMVDEIVRAAAQLARNRYGALIVIERDTGLQEYAERGVQLDALLTRQLLINIFYPNSPLHDAAALVRSDRIVAASVVLPLTDNISASGQLGTRHRAAIGISEVSDALAVVASEETGQVAVAHNGRLIRNLDQDRLRRVLRSLLHLDRPTRERSGRIPSMNGRSIFPTRPASVQPSSQSAPARRDAEPTKTA